MFTVIGCLGTVVGQVDSTEQAVTIVLSQVPISDKKAQTARNAVQRLAKGAEYHVEYGGSGCTIRRS